MNNDEHSEITVRRALTAEITAVIALLKASPTAAQWSASSFLPYCIDKPEIAPQAARQMRAMFVATTFDSPPSHKGNIVGFAAFSALAYRDAAECDLDNMAVDAAWRKRGIGRQLLAAGRAWMLTCIPTFLTAEASSQPDSALIWLEVRASNSTAIAFYRNAGFTIADRRRSYYSQPEEDAIVMRKNL